MSSIDPGSSRGFFSSLYDLSFHKFVTPAIIQVIYVIALIVIAIWALCFLALGFMPHALLGYGYGYGGPNVFTMIFHIVGAAVIFVLGSICARIYLEIIVAVFRIAENTEGLRARE